MIGKNQEREILRRLYPLRDGQGQRGNHRLRRRTAGKYPGNNGQFQLPA